MMTRWANRPLRRRQWQAGCSQFQHLLTHPFLVSHLHRRHHLRHRLRPDLPLALGWVRLPHHLTLGEVQGTLGEAQEHVGSAVSRQEGPYRRPRRVLHQGVRVPLYLRAQAEDQVEMQVLARLLWMRGSL